MVQVALVVHIVGAAVALFVGPFQFWAASRRRFPGLHRWLGRTYLVGVGVGGIASLVMAPFNTAGMIGFLGFGTLGVLWSGRAGAPTGRSGPATCGRTRRG